MVVECSKLRPDSPNAVFGKVLRGIGDVDRADDGDGALEELKRLKRPAAFTLVIDVSCRVVG